MTEIPKIVIIALLLTGQSQLKVITAKSEIFIGLIRLPGRAVICRKAQRFYCIVMFTNKKNMSNLLNKPPLQTCEPISDNKADNNTVPSAPEHNKRQKLIDNSSAEKCISISVGRSPLKNISASESNNIQFRDRSPLRNEENLRSLFFSMEQSLKKMSLPLMSLIIIINKLVLVKPI